jgi:hypothetical protein
MYLLQVLAARIQRDTEVTAASLTVLNGAHCGNYACFNQLKTITISVPPILYAKRSGHLSEPHFQSTNSSVIFITQSSFSASPQTRN